MYEGAQSRRLLCGIVSTPEDIARNPQLKFRKWLTDVEHPELGATAAIPRPSIRLLGDAVGDPSPAAAPSASTTEEVLGEIGIGGDMVAALRATGAI